MPSENVTGQRVGADPDTRELLVRQHLSLVHRVARHLSRRLSTHADLQELVSCGTLGLMDAVDHFDPTRGVVFSTFAVPRIRGAILDELRRQDHVPRSVRRKARLIAQATEALTHALGRPATEQELAERLGVDVETLWSWRADVEGRLHLSLDAAADDPDGEMNLESAALAGEDPSESVVNREQVALLLRRAIEQLKEKERRVLTLYYFEELKLQQIAQLLGLTESRISQIHTAALTRLRESLAHLPGALS